MSARALSWALAVCLLVPGLAQAQSALDTWSERPSSLRAVAADGAGRVVAVGDFGAIRISTDDGLTWHSVKSNITTGLKGVAFGAGVWMAVGDNGVMLTSSDANAWAPEAPVVTNSLRGVAFGNGVFVAVGVGGDILTSLDGITWAIYQCGCGALNNVSFASGRFIVPGDNSRILTSVDGVNWDQFTGPETPAKNLLAATGGRTSAGHDVLVAAGADTRIYLNDLTAGGGWSIAAHGFSSGPVNAAAFANGRFVLADDGFYANIFAWSDDPFAAVAGSSSAWTEAAPGAGVHYAITFTGTRFVAVGLYGVINTSPDALTWTLATFNRLSFADIAYGHNTFIAGGECLGLLRSADARDWTFQDTTAICDGTWLGPMVYGNGRFVSARYAGWLVSTDDGVTWKKGPLPVSGDVPRRTAFGNGLFMTVGATYYDQTVALTSVDGMTWARHILPGSIATSVTFADGLFYVASDAGIFSSPDGQSWAQVASLAAGTDWVRDVAVGSGRIVAVADTWANDNNTFMISSDGGATWTTQPTPAPNVRFLAYGNGVFAAAGATGSILTSNDLGATWQSHSLAGTAYATVAVERLIFAQNTFLGVTAEFPILQSGVVPLPQGRVSVSVSGLGRVISSPAGIDCGSTCVASFDLGSTVTLSASTVSGSTFAGWSGDCSAATASVNVLVGANTSCTAAFTGGVAKPTAVLRVNGSAGPNVSVAWDSSFTLDGSASSSAIGGTIAEYRWTSVTAKVPGLAQNATVTTTTATFPISIGGGNAIPVGQYVFQLVVIDSSGNISDPAQIAVVVVDQSKPTAVLSVIGPSGPTTRVSWGQGFTLDGGASFDVGGNVAQYRWMSVTSSVPGLAQNAPVTTTAPSFPIAISANPIPPGQYVFQLVVIDDSGNVSDPTQIQLVVVDEAKPTAVLRVIGPSGPTTRVSWGQAFTLDGASSFDVGGNVAQYRWTSLTASVPGLAQNATVTTTTAALAVAVNPGSPIAPGQYTFQLVVVDDSGNVSYPTQGTIIVVDDAKPTAVLKLNGSNATIIASGASFTLDGSASFDVGGTIAEYRWTSLTASVPGLAQGVAVTTTTPTFAVAVTPTAPIPPGSYVFQLVVADDSGNVSAPFQLTARIGDTSPPTAVLSVNGSSGTVTVPYGQSVQLDGSASTDVGGVVAQWEFTLLSGAASDMALNTPIVSSRPFLPLGGTGGSPWQTGAYVFQLIVVDDSGNRSAPVQLTLLILDQSKPTAVLDINGGTSSSTKVPFGEGFTLDGGRSFDVGGRVAQYRWRSLTASVPGLSVGVAVTTTTATLPVTVTPSAAIPIGPYEFELVVIDDSGNESYPARLTIVVVDLMAPTAVVKVNGSAGEVTVMYGQPFVLDGSGSTDAGGGVVQRYRWTSLTAAFPTLPLDTPVTGTSASWSLGFSGATSPLAGRYVFQLVVIDDSGNVSMPAQVAVRVIDTIAPTAVLKVNPAQAGYGEPFTLDGSASSDIGGRVAKYTWRSISADVPGLVRNTAVTTTTSTFSVPGSTLPLGSYTFSLSVTDDSGNVSTNAVAILNVVDKTAPTAVLTAPPTVPWGRSFSLDGSASFDVLGRVAVYEWTSLTAGVPGLPLNQPIVTRSQTFRVSVNPGAPLSAGRYVFQLVVVDDSGNRSAPMQVALIVVDQAPPTAVLSAPRIVGPGTALTLDGTQSSDLGGRIVEYRWTSLTADVTGMAVGVSVVTTTPTLAIAIASRGPLPRGGCDFELVVVDDAGNVSKPDRARVIIR